MRLCVARAPFWTSFGRCGKRTLFFLLCAGGVAGRGGSGGRRAWLGRGLLSCRTTALEYAGGGCALESGSIGSGKRSAAARRALRAMLVEKLGEISALIEKLMWEEISFQTLVPGVHAPAFSCRAWVEQQLPEPAWQSCSCNSIRLQ